MASVHVGPDLSSTRYVSCHLMHLSIIENMMNLCKNTKSYSTCLLNLSGISMEAIECGEGLTHARHAAQVSTTGLIKASASLGQPAKPRSLVMELADACHQRICNFLNSNLRCASVPALRARRDLATSKFLQSVVFSGPVAASLYARLVLCS